MARPSILWIVPALAVLLSGCGIAARPAESGPEPAYSNQDGPVAPMAPIPLHPKSVSLVIGPIGQPHPCLALRPTMTVCQ
jgi:hypothetical protein